MHAVPQVIFSGLLILQLVFSASPASSQPSEDNTSAREIIESEARMAQVKKELESTGQPLDASSPLGTLLKLQEAFDAEDYDKAGEFLDMRYLPAALKGKEAGELMQQLRYIWNRQKVLDITLISDRPEGRQNDGLPAYRDLLGEIELSTGPVPIYLQRVPDGKGGHQWKFSNATVARIPEMWDELGIGPLAQYLKEHLPDFRMFNMDNWQLLYLGLAVLLGWPVVSLICLAMGQFVARRPGPLRDAIRRFLRFQLRIFLYIIMVQYVALHIGLPLKTRVLIQSAGFMHIAVVVLLAGIINIVHGYQARRLIQASRDHYVALLKPAATAVKILMIITVGLIWAKDAGYDMSTVLAGLGVGSLAVALAAQKTLENIIGAITIYTARPIKPGDFCRFGDTIGTVQEIGLRSTVLRTLNRTLVSIPNSVFSAAEVENYSQRDRIRYFRNLRLEISSAEQLQLVLEELRKLFESTDKVLRETISIRFEEITDNTAQLRVDAGIATREFDVYLEVAEALNLQIVHTIQEAGGKFSGPGRQLTLHNAIGTGEQHDALEKFLAAEQPATSDPV